MNETTATLIIVSGLSGSGKSVALRTLEDLGFYCIDNLPAKLLPSTVADIAADIEQGGRIAVSIDVRNLSHDLSRMGQLLSEVNAAGYQTRLVFFDTEDAVLIKRFSDTRRKHPLSLRGLTLSDAIAEERKQLRPLVALADTVIDSSEMNVHQLRKRVIDEVQDHAGQAVSVLFESFAYKKGVPSDADFVFDTRCLPNPHWLPALRPLSGKDAPVRAYFEADETVRVYLAQVTAFIDAWLPRFESESRSYLTVAFGCTGGRHRSVYLAESLARHCAASGRDKVMVHHRELE
ncbi:nucleotide-binding protein [Arenimonas maotaiensis]|uniref:Nucleotide-binding protein n=1 Tax=Arenimonas maotaiensis TaxID=1446479 RepID=A0A917FKF9_9GAMM|nr:RNase adapter RapZ [Arenimonas maotaiensis]GGF86548.1 nucleotide-binding protein [Arenimonas maotaiensis]